MGGSHTTWTEALLACRNSQSQNLRGKERGTGISLGLASAVAEGCTGARHPTGLSSPHFLACQLDVHVSVQQEVLRLEVPVDYVVVMAVLYC